MTLITITDMKTYSKLFFVGCIAALGLTACSLNRIPDDPNTIMTFDQDAVFTKVYATLATTGQNGPDGNGDVDGVDEGTSSFYRMLWELNEFPTDEGWWIWGDPGVADLRIMSWNSSNSLVEGVYFRLYFDITLCNSFLANTEGKTDEKTLQQRAEVRFIRALNEYYLLDMFGTVPNATGVSVEDPEPIKRADLFAKIETELLALCDASSDEALPDKRLSLFRVDKVAAELLLARLYLNAEVYTGTARWNEAAEYAGKVMASDYKLLTEGTGMYSAYQKLFMGDNDTNGAQNEAVLLVYQDGDYTESWGGSRFLINATRDAGWLPSGSSDSWSCFRSSPELIAMFTDIATAGSIKKNEYNMPAELGDDRAIFCTYSDSSTSLTWALTGPMSSEFYDCWGICKWTGVYSTAALPEQSVGHNAAFPDTDIPFMRVAEAYLTYAEAVYRGGTATNGTAEEAVKALRNRANNTTAFTLSDDFLLDEWGREFYCEGRRRSDLVRFGQFAGEKATRNWEGRGGAKSGAAVKAVDKKFNIFPLPYADVTANKNLAGLNEANGY